MYSTQKVLAIAQEAEAEISNNKGRRKPKKRSINLELGSDEDDVVANVLSDYESDLYDRCCQGRGSKHFQLPRSCFWISAMSYNDCMVSY